jgi:hypothetical protein
MHLRHLTLKRACHDRLAQSLEAMRLGSPPSATVQVPHCATQSNEINKLHEPSKAGSEKTPPIHPKFSRVTEKRMSWRATKLVATH